MFKLDTNREDSPKTRENYPETVFQKILATIPRLVCMLRNCHKVHYAMYTKNHLQPIPRQCKLSLTHFYLKLYQKATKRLSGSYETVPRAP